jgi:hypothetical protein
MKFLIFIALIIKTIICHFLVSYTDDKGRKLTFETNKFTLYDPQESQLADWKTRKNKLEFYYIKKSENKLNKLNWVKITPHGKYDEIMIDIEIELTIGNIKKNPLYENIKLEEEDDLLDIFMLKGTIGHLVESFDYSLAWTASSSIWYRCERREPQTTQVKLNYEISLSLDGVFFTIQENLATPKRIEESFVLLEGEDYNEDKYRSYFLDIKRLFIINYYETDADQFMIELHFKKPRKNIIRNKWIKYLAHLNDFDKNVINWICMLNKHISCPENEKIG